MEKIICIATPLYAPEIGGPATHVALLEQELPSRGFALRIVKFSDVRKLPKFVRHIAYFFAVLREARGASFIYALDPVSVGLPAALAAKVRGLPFILRVGGDYAWEQGAQRFGVTQTLDEFVTRTQKSLGVRILQRIQSFVARRAQVVIAPSRYLGTIIQTWGVPQSRIRVVYSQPELPTEHLSRSDARARLHLSENERVLFTAGRLVPWKGFAGLVAAAAKTETRPKVFIAGSGPYFAELTHEVETLGMKDSVTFLGRISHEEIYTWLSAADAFALNTKYEGLSHQVLEAFAVGTPVITTSVGGNTELIENEKEGLLVAVDDVSALARAIDRVLTDTSFAESLVRGARASLARFNPHTAADALAAIFKEI